MAGHAHQHDDFTRAFAVGIALNVAIVVIELVFGLLGNSMALISDAGHNLSDVLGLVVGWAGAVMAKRSPSPRFTYGFKKASILAALINALFLLVAVGAIAAEAVRRLLHPAPAEAQAMIWVAASRLSATCSPQCCSRAGGSTTSMSAGAYHAHGRRRGGVGGGGVRGLRDPVDRAAMGRSGDEPRGRLVILWGSVGLLKESVGMSLMGVPEGIAVEEVEAELGRARRRRDGPRPSHLAAEHDRDRAYRASRRADRGRPIR